MDRKTFKQRKHLNAQVIALFYSGLFIGIIFYGFNNLLGSLGEVLSVILALVLAVFAWAIARFIGYDEGGIRGNIPAFALLLIISAVGIFNSLMLNLEGKRIFSQRINHAEELFNTLEVTAMQEQKSQGIEEKIKEVETAKAALMSEISSPGNCGNGPEARRIRMELKRILVNLELPSGRIDCNDPESVRRYVDAYTDIINVTMSSAEWNNPALQNIILDAGESRAKLSCLESGCATTRPDYDGLLRGVNVRGDSSISDVMRVVTPKLEELDGVYSRSVEILQRNASAPPSLEPDLALEEIRSIGQISQILNLIIARADQITTYVYLTLAVLFDALMVYFFQNVLKFSVSSRRGTMKVEQGW